MPDEAPTDLLWRPSPFADLVRYTLAAALVLGLGGGAMLAFDHTPDGPIASGTEEAVLLDLPPALASSAPSREAAEGPAQEANASAAPPKDAVPDEKPDATPPVPDAQFQPAPVHTPPPVTPTAPEDAKAPAGSQAPDKQADPIDSDAARLRAAHAMALWQKTMLTRLEQAKAGISSGGLAGKAMIAFTIDRRGHVLASRITQTSGSSRLDQAALTLLNRAAPFPEPPAAVAEKDLSFTVPVAFARRRQGFNHRSQTARNSPPPVWASGFTHLVRRHCERSEATVRP